MMKEMAPDRVGNEGERIYATTSMKGFCDAMFAKTINEACDSEKNRSNSNADESTALLYSVHSAMILEAFGSL